MKTENAPVEIKHMRGEFERQGLRDLCQWLSKRVEMKSMVEIGSWAGESALVFAEYFQEVVCVDSWEDNNAVAYPFFLQATKDIPNIRCLKMRSAQAVSEFADGSLSFVYVDGRHRYESVREDVALWTSKAKALGGHDYELPRFEEVVRAVDSIYGKPPIVFQDTSWIGKWGD